jgi:four helix bundle protein
MGVFLVIIINERIMPKIRTHRELEVFQLAFDIATEIHELSKEFPKEEKYGLISQVRRSSCSICANTAEAFRKRKYPGSFVAKLSDAEGEAAETQVWLDLSLHFGYISLADYQSLNEKCERVIGKLVTMSRHPEHWSVDGDRRVGG